MKNFKTIVVISLSLVFLSWGLMAQAVGSDNVRLGSDNASDPIFVSPGGPKELDLSNVYRGGLQTKTEIVNLLREKQALVQKKINNSELIGLKRIPTALRNSVLSLNLAAKNTLSNMENKISGESDVIRVKAILQKEEASSNANKMLILYNQSALLLKNYNRVYETLQNSYRAVNDGINYIDIHNPKSSKYLGKDPFDANLYNTEIAPLRDKLEKIKTEKLDVFKASLDSKINELNKHNFASLTDAKTDAARRDVLDILVLDLPVYKTDYNANIKTDIVSNISTLLVATGAKIENISDAACPEMIDADGNIYQTVLIGDQCWTKENMRVGEMITGASQPNPSNGIIEKWCYKNDPNNCETYGGLYTWNEAMQGSIIEGTQGICAPGWHIPTDAEYNILEKTVLGMIDSPNAQYVCDLSSDSGWRRCADDTGNDFGANGVGQALRRVGLGSGVGAGTDIVGFNADLPGYRATDAHFYYLGSALYLWSSTPASASTAWRRFLYTSYSTVYRVTYNVAYGYSVRCLKN